MGKRNLVVPLVAIGLLVAACGSDHGGDAAGDRTIKVQMKDIAFAPTTLTVAPGGSVHFEFDNVGKIDHEAIIGDTAAQDEHEIEMTSPTTTGSGMDHGAEMERDAITVKP